jgi:hypothetical protein
MSYEGRENLELLEQLARNYNKFLSLKFISVFRKAGLEQRDSILDFGAGIGTLAKNMRKYLPNQIHCLEIDSEMCKGLEQSGFVSVTNMESLSQNYKFMYMSNVLEHIEEDVAILSLLRERVVVDSGVIVIYVPAFQVLFSDMDSQVGHFRRYNKKSLRHVVSQSGWNIASCEYVDSIGFVSVFTLKFLLKRDLSVSSSSKLIKFYDQVLFPLSRALDKLGARFLFGKNLLLVASTRKGFTQAN